MSHSCRKAESLHPASESGPHKTEVWRCLDALASLLRLTTWGPAPAAESDREETSGDGPKQLEWAGHAPGPRRSRAGRLGSHLGPRAGAGRLPSGFGERDDVGVLLRGPRSRGGARSIRVPLAPRRGGEREHRDAGHGQAARRVAMLVRQFPAILLVLVECRGF